MLETLPTNTKTLPQLPLAVVLDELFENGADMIAVETCSNEPLVSSDHIRPSGEPRSPRFDLRSWRKKELIHQITRISTKQVVRAVSCDFGDRLLPCPVFGKHQEGDVMRYQ